MNPGRDRIFILVACVPLEGCACVHSSGATLMARQAVDHKQAEIAMNSRQTYLYPCFLIPKDSELHSQDLNMP